MIKEYIEKRRKGGLSNASINRELAGLKRMFHLGRQCTPPKVGVVPYIPMLKESNVRKGFFDHQEFVALRKALPDPINSVITFAYHTGWRRKEILTLTWDRVDFQGGTIRLDPGETKNGEGRTVYMNKDLLAEMQFLHMNRAKSSPLVFHRDGKAVKDFRKAWVAALEETGLKGRIFHDFRRTAVRNMVRSGIAERVAMQISGHKTRSIFDRYHIVSVEDLKEASRKQEVFLESQAVTGNGYNLVTI